MAGYIFNRLPAYVLVFFIVTLLVFSLIHTFISPFKYLFPNTILSMSEEQAQELLERCHYYDPFIVQYGRWMGKVLSGDIGAPIYSLDN